MQANDSSIPPNEATCTTCIACEQYADVSGAVCPGIVLIVQAGGGYSLQPLFSSSCSGTHDQKVYNNQKVCMSSVPHRLPDGCKAGSIVQMRIYTEKLHAEKYQYCQGQCHQRLIPDIPLQDHTVMRWLLTCSRTSSLPFLVA